MFLKTKLKDGPRLGKKAKKFLTGQATLELAMAIVCVLLLFWACTKVFLWLNDCIVKRQYLYEQTRTTAGSASDDTPVQVDDRYWNLIFFPD